MDKNLENEEYKKEHARARSYAVKNLGYEPYGECDVIKDGKRQAVLTNLRRNAKTGNYSSSTTWVQDCINRKCEESLLIDQNEHGNFEFRGIATVTAVGRAVHSRNNKKGWQLIRKSEIVLLEAKKKTRLIKKAA